MLTERYNELVKQRTDELLGDLEGWRPVGILPQPPEEAPGE